MSLAKHMIMVRDTAHREWTDSKGFSRTEAQIIQRTHQEDTGYTLLAKLLEEEIPPYQQVGGLQFLKNGRFPCDMK